MVDQAHPSPEHVVHEATPTSGAAPTYAPPKGNVLHEYDGIQELDNGLPRWWVYVLFATIVFGIGYWYWYHVYKISPLPGAEYHQEMQAVYAAEAERLRAEGAVTPAALVALSHDDATVARGRAVFTTTCAPCHMPDGRGNIGPNLTDSFWLYGGAPDHVFHTVMHGTNNGMPAWGPQLGQQRVESVVAYLVTIRNTNVPGGKPPQGTHEE